MKTKLYKVHRWNYSGDETYWHSKEKATQHAINLTAIALLNFVTDKAFPKYMRYNMSSDEIAGTIRDKLNSYISGELEISIPVFSVIEVTTQDDDE